jgi:programmed cell death protein 5
MVKPSKANAIQDLLIRMAQSGQVRQKVTEQQLIGLLDQVEGRQQGGLGSGGGGSTGGAGKITVSADE